MIEKILEKLEAERNDYLGFDDDDYFVGKSSAFEKAIEIVQEVAKEHGRKLNRCDTCTYYVADTVPPICYFCSKGMEDNYKAREGERCS